MCMQYAILYCYDCLLRQLERVIIMYQYAVFATPLEYVGTPSQPLHEECIGDNLTPDQRDRAIAWANANGMKVTRIAQYQPTVYEVPDFIGTIS